MNNYGSRRRNKILSAITLIKDAKVKSPQDAALDLRATNVALNALSTDTQKVASSSARTKVMTTLEDLADAENAADVVMSSQNEVIAAQKSAEFCAKDKDEIKAEARVNVIESRELANSNDSFTCTDAIEGDAASLTSGTAIYDFAAVTSEDEAQSAKSGVTGIADKAESAAGNGTASLSDGANGKLLGASGTKKLRGRPKKVVSEEELAATKAHNIELSKMADVIVTDYYEALTRSRIYQVTPQNFEECMAILEKVMAENQGRAEYINAAKKGLLQPRYAKAILSASK